MSGANGQPVIDTGGVEGVPSPFLALDPTNPKDQALIRREIARHPARWRKMDERRKAYVIGCLDWSMRVGRAYEPSAEGEHPLDGARLVVSAAKTYVAIEGQNQSDDHHADNARLKAAEVANTKRFVVEYRAKELPSDTSSPDAGDHPRPEREGAGPPNP